MRKALLVVLPAWWVSGLAHANVRLPKLVGDHMVFQQNTRLPLRGWAGPGEKVTLTFQNRQLSTKAGKDGGWTATPAPGGNLYNREGLPPSLFVPTTGPA